LLEKHLAAYAIAFIAQDHNESRDASSLLC